MLDGLPRALGVSIGSDGYAPPLDGAVGLPLDGAVAVLDGLPLGLRPRNPAPRRAPALARFGFGSVGLSVGLPLSCAPYARPGVALRPPLAP